MCTVWLDFLLVFLVLLLYGVVVVNSAMPEVMSLGIGCCYAVTPSDSSPLRRLFIILFKVNA